MKKQIEMILQKHTEMYGFVSTKEYMSKENDRAKKTLDHSFLDGYQTIVTIAIPYPQNEVKYKGKGYGLLSRYSYGIDYHIVVREILNKITLDLKSIGVNAYGSVDISKISERAAAYYSKIGFIGKNQFIINHEFGSYIYLATLLIDHAIFQEDMLQDDCGDCRICIDACPSGALDNGFNQSKCISQITQEKKALSDTEVSYIKTMIYGCDICQKVCPKNKGVVLKQQSKFEPSGIENVDIKWLFEATNKEYSERYGTNASSWKGPLILRRNALCIIKNQKLKEYVPIIKRTLEKYKEVSWYNETANKIIKDFESE